MKLISGGQTGADRGALEAARELGLPYGGWIPKGRHAEDGIVPLHFDQLKEHNSGGYLPRTRANVREADATVIFAKRPWSGGSKRTLDLCRDEGKPVFTFTAEGAIENREFVARSLLLWLDDKGIKVLNVAGSRESQAPGLQAAVKDLFLRLLKGEVPREVVITEEDVAAAAEKTKGMPRCGECGCLTQGRNYHYSGCPRKTRNW